MLQWRSYDLKLLAPVARVSEHCEPMNLVKPQYLVGMQTVLTHDAIVMTRLEVLGDRDIVMASTEVKAFRKRV